MNSLIMCARCRFNWCLAYILLLECLFVPRSSAQSNEEHYTIKLHLRAESCVPCIKGLLSLKFDRIGALQDRISIQVITDSKVAVRRVREVIEDTNLVKIHSVSQLQTNEKGEVFVSTSPKPLSTFKLPEGVHRLVDFIDSVDALGNPIVVDSVVSDRTYQLKTYLQTNQSTQVHMFDDGQWFALLAKDRAAVVRKDTAFVLPQYLRDFPDSLKQHLVMPKRMAVVNQERAVYQVITAEKPIDTVINGEVAKLYTASRTWESTISTAPTLVNRVVQVPPAQRVFGMWMVSSTQMMVVPEIESEEVPTHFALESCNPLSTTERTPFADSIPAKYFPISPAQADGTSDTMYLCSSDSGWVRITKSEGLLHLHTLPYLHRESSLIRCIALNGKVLLTYENGDGMLVSVLVSSLGIRSSPLVYHPANVIAVPNYDKGGMGIRMYQLRDNQLVSMNVWQALSKK